MGRTCGEPDEIGPTPMGVKLNGLGRVHVVEVKQHEHVHQEPEQRRPLGPPREHGPEVWRADDGEDEDCPVHQRVPVCTR